MIEASQIEVGAYVAIHHPKTMGGETRHAAVIAQIRKDNGRFYVCCLRCGPILTLSYSAIQVQPLNGLEILAWAGTSQDPIERFWKKRAKQEGHAA